MPKKSIWDSNVVKAIAAIAALVTIIGFILQYFGTFDVWKILIVPIVNFFNISVPLFSIPLAFLIVVGGFLLILYIDEKLRPSSASSTVNDPFYRADFLDKEFARYMAVLCKTPRTPDFLKQEYNKYYSNYDYCLKELEDSGLVKFQNGKWEITQKALDYIAKYHGD